MRGRRFKISIGGMKPSEMQGQNPVNELAKPVRARSPVHENKRPVLKEHRDRVNHTLLIGCPDAKMNESLRQRTSIQSQRRIFASSAAATKARRAAGG